MFGIEFKFLFINMYDFSFYLWRFIHEGLFELTSSSVAKKQQSQGG